MRASPWVLMRATRPVLPLFTMRSRTDRWFVAATAALVGALAACSSATGGAAGGEGDAPTIGLRRGARWSVLALRPPHLTGPHFHLLLRGGTLSGSIASATAPAGNLKVRITPTGAHGYGPLGPISMDYLIGEASTLVEGMWNGARVRLEFAPHALKGTVAENSDVLARAEPERMMGTATHRARRRQGPQVNANISDPLPDNSSCQYVLEQLEPDGALSGPSICSGMPQQTRLEVPKVAQSLFTQAELVTLLVAVLSAPPAVGDEELGPKFTDPASDMIRRR